MLLVHFPPLHDDQQVGYCSVDGANGDPAHCGLSSTKTLNLQAQADLYTALFEVAPERGLLLWFPCAHKPNSACTFCARHIYRKFTASSLLALFLVQPSTLPACGVDSGVASGDVLRRGADVGMDH
jgi:hypothetical protein